MKKIISLIIVGILGAALLLVPDSYAKWHEFISEEKKISEASKTSEWVYDLNYHSVRGLRASKVATNELSQFVIDVQGDLYAVGYNAYGMLGINAAGGSINSFAMIEFPSGEKIQKVSVGVYHTVVLTQSGLVYAMGLNDYGALGIGSSGGQKNTPTIVPILKDIVDVGAGYLHSIAVNSKGEVFTWGLNSYGKLGIDNEVSQYSPVQLPTFNSPIIQVEAGYDSTYALTQDGNVFSWGYNGDGVLGIGVNGGAHRVPRAQAKNGSYKIVKISLKTYSGFYLTEDGEVYTWGYNNVYQLGLNDLTSRVTPVPLIFPSKIVDFDSARYSAFFITENGELYVTGAADEYRLGLPLSPARYTVPTIHPFLKNNLVFVKTVSGGTYHGALIDIYGRVHTFGSNAYGQQGNGGTIARHEVPTIISFSTKTEETLTIVSFKQNISLSLLEPIRPGYTFEGWYLNPEYTGIPATNGVTFDKLTHLYAKWRLGI